MKVLVVDDSAIYRRVLEDIVGAVAFVERVEVAGNGNEALAKAFTFQPDLITLDMEMPDISGMQVLRALKAAGHRAAVVVVSAHTDAGTRLAVEAMQLGAADVLVKPQGLSGRDAIQALTQRLRPIVQGLSRTKGATRPEPVPLETAPSRRGSEGCEIIAMGASTGGPAVLSSILQHLPGDLRIPVVITVHMPAGFTAHLAASLGKRCAARVIEAQDGDRLAPRTIYLAPAGRHMRVTKALATGPCLGMDDSPPRHGCRPSVDVLFHSVAESYGPSALGVLLTGMGRDGAEGLAAMRRRGARTIAQDEQSCVVWGMPRAAVEAGAVDVVASPDEIVTYLLAAMKA
jgi:two-component system chemotaxis response regulator CheB